MSNLEYIVGPRRWELRHEDGRYITYDMGILAAGINTKNQKPGTETKLPAGFFGRQYKQIVGANYDGKKEIIAKQQTTTKVVSALTRYGILPGENQKRDNPIPQASKSNMDV